LKVNEALVCILIEQQGIGWINGVLGVFAIQSLPLSTLMNLILARIMHLIGFKINYYMAFDHVFATNPLRYSNP
jgi:hypothetical protein